MSFMVSAPRNEGFEPLAEGVHVAVCYGLYDLGTHYSQKWEKSSRQVLVCWEIPAERCEIGGEDLPRAISKKVTLSLHPKSGLYKLLVAWRGKPFTAEELAGFDLKAVLGASCQLQVLHYDKDGEKKHYVENVMSLPKGAAKPKPENALQYFCFDDSGPIPDGTPEWIANIIKESAEYKGRNADAGAPADDDDDPPPMLSDQDIPF